MGCEWKSGSSYDFSDACLNDICHFKPNFSTHFGNGLSGVMRGNLVMCMSYPKVTQGDFPGIATMYWQYNKSAMAT